ncbi:hypothetical protein [Phenylobacterium sp.]|uniref:hypothetical protein n=1 Tax=Phenylobacterium sp. TaxID=1871053 RepID=UPI00374D8031
MKITDWLQAISALAVAVLTYFLWQVGKRQAELTNQNVKIAKEAADAATQAARAAESAIKQGAETAKRQLRAYVHNEGYHFEPRISGAGLEWHIQVRWKNAGLTPALKTISTGNWAELPDNYKIPAGFDFPNLPDAQFHPGNIGPGQLVSTHVDISAEKIWDAYSNSRSIAVWAWMEYGDALDPDVRRRTEVSNYLFVHGDPRQPTCAFSLALTALFNGVDDDCLKPIETTNT